MPKARRGRAYSSQYASQSQYGASQSGARRSVKYGRVARIARGPSTLTPTFTETYSLSNLASNTGGVFAAQMSAIPQLADYSALYRTFRILSFEVLVMPNFIVNQVDGGNQATVPRLVHSWDKSAEVLAPTAEVDVLNDNACKIHLLSKPVRLLCTSPKPRVAMNIPATGGLVGVDLGRQNWLSFDDGSAIPHNGMPYWINTYSGALAVGCYIKVKFQCRDPR